MAVARGGGKQSQGPQGAGRVAPLENTGSCPSEPSRPVSCFSTRRAFSSGSPLVPTQMLSTSFSTASSRIGLSAVSPIVRNAGRKERAGLQRSRTSEKSGGGGK